VHNVPVSHDDLTLDGWLGLSDEAAERTAKAIARDVDGRLVGVELRVFHGRDGRVAFFDRDGLRYALVPGGTVRVGYEAGRFVPSARQVADFAEAAAAWDLAGTIETYVAGVTSPARTATLPARLVAVGSAEAYHLLEVDEDHASIVAALDARGLRLPTPDEWEYCCGAGVGTLFRWGDDYPEGEPYGDVPLIQAPNFFGLVIGDDPYQAEFTAERDVFCGGDGGSALCGGSGPFLSWITVATAFRDEFLADAIYDGGLVGETPVRPVLPLP
jgi:hypothetical protein